MDPHFTRTLRVLGDERRLSTPGLVLVALVLAGWLAWLAAARISVFEVTTLGRLEVDRAAHPIESRADGRVVAVPAAIGRRVEAGEVLVELETDDLELRRKEERGRLAALQAELEAARQELRLRTEALEEGRRGAVLELAEARSRLREAEIEEGFARQEAERAAVLHREGQVSKADADRLAAEAERLAAAVKSLGAAVARLESEGRSSELEVQTEIAQLRGAVARLEGEAAAAEVALEELDYEIGKRRIRAPRAGEVGELVSLAAGSLVHEGDRLGTLLAAGEIQVAADFAPASAIGRVEVGQRAQVRLDGFPWTQYGLLEATVTRVAGEPRDGKLRVELEVDPQSAVRIPVQHGLTGTVEVEVERLSPALLLLRALGKAVAPRS